VNGLLLLFHSGFVIKARYAPSCALVLFQNVMSSMLL
jgi:hypothetical protein